MNQFLFPLLLLLITSLNGTSQVETIQSQIQIADELLKKNKPQESVKLLNSFKKDVYNHIEIISPFYSLLIQAEGELNEKQAIRLKQEFLFYDGITNHIKDVNTSYSGNDKSELNKLELYYAQFKVAYELAEYFDKTGELSKCEYYYQLIEEKFRIPDGCGNSFAEEDYRLNNKIAKLQFEQSKYHRCFKTLTKYISWSPNIINEDPTTDYEMFVFCIKKIFSKDYIQQEIRRIESEIVVEGKTRIYSLFDEDFHQHFDPRMEIENNTTAKKGQNPIDLFHDWYVYKQLNK